MSDKVRGAIGMLVGVFALWQSYVLFQSHRRDWHMWLEIVAGLFLILIGAWRMARRGRAPNDPRAELMK